MPSENIAKFWDRMADRYSKTPIKDEASYQKKLQITQQYLRPDMEMVEIGCGTGGTSIIHSSHVKHILATDISSNMIKIAENKAAEAKVSNVEFRVSSVEQLDREIPIGSKDVVLGCSILHLVENKDNAMTSVHRWLKPGGLFVTSTVCLGDMGWGVKILANTLLPVGQFFGLLPVVNSFSKQELKESFKKAGFAIEHEWEVDKQSVVFIIGKKE